MEEQESPLDTTFEVDYDDDYPLTPESFLLSPLIEDEEDLSGYSTEEVDMDEE